MKTTITEEDLKKAQKETEFGDGTYTCSCLYYQAAKRCGVPVRFVRIRDMRLMDGTHWPIPESLWRITRAKESLWPSFVGTEIELPDL